MDGIGKESGWRAPGFAHAEIYEQKSGWCTRGFSHAEKRTTSKSPAGARQVFHMQKSTSNLPERQIGCHNLARHCSHKKDGTSRSTQMTMTGVTRKKARRTPSTMIPPPAPSAKKHETPPVPSAKKHETAADKDRGKELPTSMVMIDKSSEQSQMSSIGIGEFGMRASKKGITKTFAMAVREHLF